MPDKVFFQCSLPRVGSTMFQNLLNQDARFYASANNGLLNLLGAAQNSFNTCEEFKAQDAEQMKKAFQGFCKQSMHGFYSAITDKEYVLDKSRGNFADYNLINSYYPDPRIICFVRNVPDIIASMEKLFRKNQHKSNPIVNPAAMQGITTLKRADFWHRSLMTMVERLAQTVYQGIDTKMLFVKYESFCLQPELEMQRVYEYLEIPPFNLNFNQIEKTIIEDEEVYNYTGLFNIRPSLEMRPSDAKEILGNDVYDWIMNQYKWYNDYFGYK